MNKVLARAFVCGLAGCLVWLVYEPQFASVGFAGNRWSQIEVWMFSSLGAAIGLSAGVLSGVQRGGRHNIVTAALLGAFLGGLGGVVSHNLASVLYASMGGSASAALVPNAVARTVAFLPLGGLIGLAVGASQRALRPAVSGAVGGLAAAIATGSTFDLVSATLGSVALVAAKPGAVVETGGPARALTCLGLGIGIGLFTAIVDSVTRRAWLRLELARNEGREWPLDTNQTFIGRDERAHVPLFVDPQVPPLAAIIERRGNGYIVRDPGSPLGIGHNGIRVAEAPLVDGDIVNIGTLSLRFRTRAGAASARPEGRPRAVPIGAAGSVSVGSAVAPSAPQVLALLATNGSVAGQRFPLSTSMEVGRDASGIALADDAQASRRHCSLTLVPGGVNVTDLGSTNGTLVNGQRVTSAALRIGDTLQVGATIFQVVA